MDSESKIWYLENFNLFKKLTRDEIMKLEPLTKMNEISRAETIEIEPNQPHYVYFLKSGKVKIASVNEDGDEEIKSILFPGDIFGAMPFVPSEKGENVAVTMEDSVICRMESSMLEELMAMNIKLNSEIFKVIGLRLKRLERRLGNFVFLDARGRITSLLRDLAEDYGKKLGDEVFLNISLSHREIATLSATSRQTATTILNDLRALKIIDFNRKKIIIRDISRLT